MNENEKMNFAEALASARESVESGEANAPEAQVQEQAVQEEAVTEPTTEPDTEPEAPVQDAVAAQTAMTEEAIATAEQAAQIAQQKDAEVNQLKQMLEQERQHSQNLEGTLSEMNKQRETEVLAEALVPPQMDFKTIMFEDDDVIAQAQAKYAEDMAAYNRKILEKEYEPVRQQAKRLEEHEMLENLKSSLKGRAEFEGFDNPEMLKRLDVIIHNNEFLKDSNLPYEKKLINAYAIARGADAMYTPKKEPEQPKAQTVDELIEIYKNNPDFKAAIEKMRIEELSAGQQVPVLSASGGAGNVALNIKDKPQTLGDARERAKSRFFH